MTNNMKQLPDPAIYEEECRTTPWGRMVGEVLMRADRNAPMFGDLVDLMCGPGYLLHYLHKQRPDLNLKGVDLDSRFIDFARKRTLGVDFVKKDVLTWRAMKYDVVTCTAGVHHLPYDKQEPFLVKVADMLKPKGVAIIGDPYISNYNNEFERRLGAAELGDAFTTAAIRGGANDEVVKAAIDVMYNDIFGHEYKTSVRKMRHLLEKHFDVVDEKFTWRPDPKKEYGDCYFVLRKK